MPNQGALKGTNLRGFSQIFADSRLPSFPRKTKHLGNADFHRKPLIFAGNPQKTAGPHRKPLIGICLLRFLPLSAALTKLGT